MTAAVFDGSTYRAATPTATPSMAVEAWVRLAAADWTPATDQVIVSSWDTAGDARRWRVTLTSTGALRMEWTSDGVTVQSVTSTESLAGVVADGSPLWVCALLFPGFDHPETHHVVLFGYDLDTDFVDATDNTVELGTWSEDAGASDVYSVSGDVHLAGAPGDGGVGRFVGTVHEVHVLADYSVDSVVPTSPSAWEEAGGEDPPDEEDPEEDDPMAVTVAPTVQGEVWPPRAVVTVAGVPVGVPVRVWRSVAGVRTYLRGGTLTSTGVYVHVVDAEHPYGAAILWGASVNGVDYTAAVTATVTLTGGLVAVTDAVTGAAVECRVSAWPDRRWESPGTAVVVNGRTVRVSAAPGGWSGQVEVVTETTAQGEALHALLAGATSGVIMLRQPGGYDRVDSHIAVSAWTETRWSQDAVDQRRTWALEAMQVTGWPDSAGSRASTIDDVSAYYASGDADAMAADFAGKNWHDVAVLDWAGGEAP